MPWAANPFLDPAIGQPTIRPVVVTGGSDLEAAQADGRPADTASEPKAYHAPRIRPPSDHLTLHQFFYIFVLDGICAGVLAGAINFAIAYALYYDKGRDVHKDPIRLFQFPNTLAGDAAVTVFIQFLSTWLIETVRVNLDLRKGAVQPIGFITEPQWRFLRWYMQLNQREHTDEVGSLMHWTRFFVSQVVRCLVLVIVTFPFIFGACVGLLTVVGKQHDGDWDWYYTATWAPELFKLVQGAVLGLLFTPFMAAFWIVRCGWAMRDKERGVDGSEGTVYGEEQTF